MAGAREHPMSSGRMAALIGATFGLVFVLVNAGDASSSWAWPLRILGVAAYVGAVVKVLRRPDAVVSPRPSAIRVYWISVVLEVVALVVGVRVLAAYGHSDYGVAWIAIVVGVHFLPFARAFAVPGFALLGIALIVLGLAGAGLGLAGVGHAAIALVAGVGSGLALMLFAVTPVGRTA